MLKTIAIAAFSLLVAIFVATAVIAQTTTPTGGTSPNPTVTPMGDTTTTPPGAPRTGFGY